MPRPEQLLSRWTLPEVVHPPTYRKFVICVPNDRFYIAAFRGLLMELTYSKNWQRDTAHTAAEVTRVWQHALNDVICDDCQQTIISRDEMEYIMSVCEQLRFHNGKLQGLCCGEWVDIDGQADSPPGGGTQPGDGTDQPGAGDCLTYHAVMNANNRWYLPTVVNTGDVLTLSSANGAGNDGTVSPWRCPSGDTFFAGACIGGSGGPAGGDPESTANHMEIVCSVDGTFYRIFDAPLTIPGGVTNGEVFFQVNDSDLTDNAGSYSFDVERCNNESPGWTSVLDLEHNEYVSFISSDYGAWSFGTGWTATAGPSGSSLWVVRLDLNFDSTTLASASVLYNAGGGAGPDTNVSFNTDPGFVLYGSRNPVGNGTDLVTATGEIRGSVTGIWIGINSGTVNVAPVMRQLTLTGQGTKPSQLP